MRERVVANEELAGVGRVERVDGTAGRGEIERPKAAAGFRRQRSVGEGVEAFGGGADGPFGRRGCVGGVLARELDKRLWLAPVVRLISCTIALPGVSSSLPCMTTPGRRRWAKAVDCGAASGGGEGREEDERRARSISAGAAREMERMSTTLARTTERGDFSTEDQERWAQEMAFSPSGSPSALQSLSMTLARPAACSWSADTSTLPHMIGMAKGANIQS